MDEPAGDPDLPWFQTTFIRRFITAVCPPLGVWLLWKNPDRSRRQKIAGSILAASYCLPYTVLLLWLLSLAGIIEFEFKGGFGPSIVRHRTAPNYYLLETHRSSQSESAAVPAPLATTEAPYWTDFRGPRRDGVYDQQPVITNWPSRGLKTLWRQPVGGGYASFVVAEGRAFTIEQRRTEEFVTAYDLETGRELWVHAYPAFFSEWMGGDGPRATPVYNLGLLYSMGAQGDLCCLGAANGKLLWRKNILADNSSSNLTYGIATSPLIVDDRIIVLAGGETRGRSVIAYHRLTGDKVWSALDDKQAYMTPLLATLAGRRQVVVVTSRRAVGLAPEDGALLWEYPWQAQHNIGVPVIVGTNRFFLSAGYGAGCALVEVSATNGGFVARQVWRNRNMRNKFNPAVFAQDHIYGLDEGVLACVDARTGERRWRQGRYGYGQLLLASGNLIVLGGEGELALVRAVPDGWHEVSRIRALSGKTWNIPAMSQGRLLVRNSAEMACFDLRPTKPRAAF